MKLSLVVPCYNEEQNVALFYQTAKAVFDAEGYSYELVFVNDG
jgi:glycosyltransferase involved in cell wall biosynthesis